MCQILDRLMPTRTKPPEGVVMTAPKPRALPKSYTSPGLTIAEEGELVARLMETNCYLSQFIETMQAEPSQHAKLTKFVIETEEMLIRLRPRVQVFA